ncbi:methyltransferase [Actinocrispum wychmicini]|uniref:O-methyltransferase n=1 Tax=Actinocrispum wychmicini TaxID=1213861 RepID=A0A4R2JCC1_9PSEU|nr:methyltransferase [Actinocrispum wychmicini]TCO56077.1 O-methyltransferase [Actinocrispum wychmicini]
MAAGRGVTEDELYRIMYGAIAFEMLHAGWAVGVFDHLGRHPGATTAQVAEALGLQRYPCDVLVTGLRGLELVLGDDSGLSNSPLVEQCFVQGEDGRHLPFVHDIVNPGISDFIGAVRAGANVGLRHFPGDGTSLYDRLEHDPDKLKVLHDHLRATSDATLADLVRTGVLADSRHLLDIGGGTGTNAIALAKHYPDLRITLLDLDNVVAEAADNIARHGLADRVDVHACDVFADPLPTGADTALLAHMLPIWSPEADRKLLRNVCSALPDNGKVLLFDPLQNDQRDGPDYAILFPAYYLAIASGHGTFYSWSTYEEWMREAGFTRFQRFPGLAVAHGLHAGWKQ